MTTSTSISTANLDEQRTVRISPLVAPAVVRGEHAPDEVAAATVRSGRADTVAILDGTDDRLLVVVGPCSVHDPAAAMDYLGWKGLLNDPHLDGTYDINTGLRIGRKLLLDVSGLGLPVGCEFLDPILPQYYADLVTYGAIGARTAASQVHRQLCSALSMPVGIKNSTEGDVQVAVDGTRAAAASHVFPGTDLDGQAALIETVGNPDCHVILRGGSAGPNYDAETVADTMARLRKAGLPERVVIDASHGNSSKDHEKQVDVVTDIAERLEAGEQGIAGVMLESFLEAGRQDLTLGRADELEYGKSITDACLDWATTSAQLDRLADAVRRRRS